MSRPEPRTDRAALALSLLGGTDVLGPLGEGGKCAVYRATWHGREVALKVYKPQALVHHATKHGEDLAAYEHGRNRAFWTAPGLARYVAEPLGFVATAEVSAFLQELLHGELYYFYYTRRNGRVDPDLFGHLRRMVHLYHAAELYDVDLHAMNVMVVEERPGGPVPKLFDFNLVPFHVRPRNPLVALLLGAGLIGKRARDLRKLRRFHDFRRIEAKLVRYYERG